MTDTATIERGPAAPGSTLPDALLYIDGKMTGAGGGRTFDIISPWTGEVVGKAADANADDVNAAITAARRAFDESDWALPESRQKRLDLVKKLRDLFEANRERLSQLAVNEAGAALGAVDRAHVNMALDGWDEYLNVFDQVEWEHDYGEKPAFGSIHKRIGVREPVGVVAAITPWNVPLYVNIGKVVAALLAGCTVILKPAPNTPGMGSIFGELAIQAGFPAGVLNVVFGSDPVRERRVRRPRGQSTTGTPRLSISSTIRPRISSRIGRTAARPWPAGSSSVQSS